MEGFLRAILGELGPSRLLELRLIKGGDKVLPLFFQSIEYAVNAAVDHSRQGWDVYFGVVPRVQHGSKASDCEQSVSVLWADYDAKTFDGDKMKAFFALSSVVPQPQIIVDSGHGYHAYWLLSEPASFEAAQDAMKGIGLETGADKCWDLPRILRVPETFNYKATQEPVRILRIDLIGRRYRINDFVDYIERVRREEWFEKKRSAERASRPRPETPIELDHMPNWLQDLILVGPPPGEDRSAQCFRVVANLLEMGWDGNRIEKLFISNPDGIGSKYVDKKGDAHRWFMTTLRSAQKALSMP